MTSDTVIDTIPPSIEESRRQLPVFLAMRFLLISAVWISSLRPVFKLALGKAFDTSTTFWTQSSPKRWRDFPSQVDLNCPCKCLTSTPKNLKDTTTECNAREGTCAVIPCLLKQNKTGISCCNCGVVECPDEGPGKPCGEFCKSAPCLEPPCFIPCCSIPIAPDPKILKRKNISAKGRAL